MRSLGELTAVPSSVVCDDDPHQSPYVFEPSEYVLLVEYLCVCDFVDWAKPKPLLPLRVSEPRLPAEFGGVAIGVDRAVWPVDAGDAGIGWKCCNS